MRLESIPTLNPTSTSESSARIPLAVTSYRLPTVVGSQGAAVAANGATGVPSTGTFTDPIELPFRPAASDTVLAIGIDNGASSETQAVPSGFSAFTTQMTEAGSTPSYFRETVSKASGLTSSGPYAPSFTIAGGTSAYLVGELIDVAAAGTVSLGAAAVTGTGTNASCPATSVAVSGSTVICVLVFNSGLDSSAPSETTPRGWTKDAIATTYRTTVVPYHMSHVPAGTLPAQPIELAGGSTSPESDWSAYTLLVAPKTSASPAPVATPLVETPLAADVLADSIGLNTHTNTAFAESDWPAIVSIVQALGVRHIRDGILDADQPYDTAISTMLTAANAKLDGITDCPGLQYYSGSATSATQIQQFDAAIGNRLEFVEGPNEVDGRGDKNWVADTVSCLPGLRSAEPSLPFLAPSLADPYKDAVTLGNISDDVDQGNIHRYFSGRNPGTAGWGGYDSCGKYGAVLWAVCLAQVNSGPKPVQVTETGYNSQTEVDEATQAKYLSRLFLVNLQAGIARSYVYDLKDSTDAGYGGDGLIRSDDSLKPAYTAIENELHYFSDPGAPVPTSSLSYQITGGKIDHLLFQKRDGTYVLALWNEAVSWNISSSSEISVPSQTITIDLPATPVAPAAVSLTDTGALAVKPIEAVHEMVTVPVDDHVTLLSFRLVTN